MRWRCSTLVLFLVLSSPKGSLLAGEGPLPLGVDPQLMRPGFWDDAESTGFGRAALEPLPATLASGAGSSHPPFRLALNGRWTASQTAQEHEARLTLDIPFDLSAGAKTSLAKFGQNEVLSAEAGAGLSSFVNRHGVETGQERTSGGSLRFHEKDVRAAIAAMRPRRSVGEGRRVASRIGERARRAGWVPSLRLRVARMLDESASFSPTSYDADRRLASGGARTWLGLRLSWDLSRIVFAPEEANLQRWSFRRLDREQQEADRIVSWLARFERSVHAMGAADASPSECRAAHGRAREAALMIDAWTSGWLSRWLAKRWGRTGGMLAVDCDVR